MAKPKQEEALKDYCLDALQSVKSDMEELQTQREEALNAYLNDKLGNEVDGRSQVLMTDVTDTIEWLMPQLMRIFYTENVVQASPVGKEDEVKARLMSQKVNYDFTQGMNGYELLHDWFKDALICKLGVIKYYWNTKTDYKQTPFNGLTEVDYQELQARVESEQYIIDKEEKIEATVQVQDEYGNLFLQQKVTYNIEGREIITTSRPLAVNVPPEEFIFPIDAKSVEEAEFIAHKKRVHKNYVKTKYKLKDDELKDEESRFKDDKLYQARFKDLGGVSFFTDQQDDDFVYLYECYVYDYSEDGTKKPMKVCIMGNQVLEVEDNNYGKPPFEVLTPVKVPHRMVGLSYADLVMEIRKIRTTLYRYILDNIYYQNNGRTVWNPFRVNMKDVLDNNNPGGVVRTLYDVEPGSTYANITPMQLPQQVFSMLEGFEQVRESATGVTRYIQGLSPSSLNKTATGITSIMNASQQRIAMLAAMWAEGGVKRMFEAFVKMNIDFFDRQTSIKLNNEWVDISPADIDGKFDLTIDVGAGTGAAEMKVNQMIQMINTYGMISQMGAPIPAKYMYSIIREVWNVWGYKNPDLFAPANEGVAAQEMAAQMQAAQQIQLMLAQQQAAAMGGMNGPMGEMAGPGGAAGNAPNVGRGPQGAAIPDSAELLGGEGTGPLSSMV